MRDVVLRFLHDDAFYYFGIARRWTRQGFPTFDGITATNGYHPLWQWLLVAASGAFPDRVTFVRAGAASGVVCLGLAAWLIARRLAEESNPYRSFAYAWVAGALLFATIYGMESPLAALLLAASVSAAPRGTVDWTLQRALTCGTATALLFLARLDALIWLVALDAVLVIGAWSGNARRMTRLIAAVVAIQVLVVGGYFLANWINWGHVLTVSAAVKAARAPTFSLAVPRSALLILAVGVTVAGIVPLVDFSMASLRGEQASAWPLTTPAWLALANLAYLATIVAKGNRETYNWYFVLTVLSGAYLLPACLERYGGWTRIPERALKLSGFALCGLLLALSVRSKITQPNGFLVQYDQAAVLASFPEDSLVLAANDCGILGYFSRQRVINLDGLTNSWDFQTALAEDRLGPWLLDRGFNAYVSSASTTVERGVVPLETRAGVQSAPRTLQLRIEPMRAAPEAPRSIGVWRVTAIER